MKLVRIILFVVILLIAVLAGVYVTGVITDLLSFQITLYSYILEGQQAVWKVTGAASDLRREAQEFLWNEWVSVPNEKADLTDERLNAYASKIKRFASLIGTVSGVAVYLLLSKIVFGLREHLKRIQSFIQ